MTRVASGELGPPPPGEALFAVERFGFSANNVTYALLGDHLRYWDLFPAEPGWGRIPVWGYLRVLASAVPGVDPGRRAFGLCPMATHVLLRPERAGQATFTEGSPHRAALSSVYNVYAWVPPGPPSDDDALVVLRPVFWLSFTLDDYLAHRAEPDQPVIVTSASSKAALGLAYLLARRGVPVTGLTSARHLPFVTRLDAYDQVLGYDQAGSLPAGPATLVDIAGDAARRDAIERNLGGQVEVVLAGGTHGDPGPLAAAPLAARPQPAESPASRAFSAPRYIRDRAREQGWPELERRYQAALEGFAAAASWLEVRRHHGLDAAARVYRDVLTDATPPAAAHVIDLTLSPATTPT
jgi:uncharacterized protein DUF2855